MAHWPAALGDATPKAQAEWHARRRQYFKQQHEKNVKEEVRYHNTDDPLKYSGNQAELVLHPTLAKTQAPTPAPTQRVSACGQALLQWAANNFHSVH